MKATVVVVLTLAACVGQVALAEAPGQADAGARAAALPVMVAFQAAGARRSASAERGARPPLPARPYAHDSIANPFGRYAGRYAQETLGNGYLPTPPSASAPRQEAPMAGLAQPGPAEAPEDGSAYWRTSLPLRREPSRLEQIAELIRLSRLQFRYPARQPRTLRSPPPAPEQSALALP